jgi:tetratricopeptide (TPR) repeat protein
MFSEDYILRMISQAVAVLVKIAGFRQAKQYGQAQQAIDQSLEQLLGLRPDLLKQLDDEVIFRTLTLQDRLDTERVVVIAELFKAEGDLLADQNRLVESQQSYLRALSFFLEAGLSDQPVPDPASLSQQVAALEKQLASLPLPDEFLWSLYIYYERSGDLGKAEAALAGLAGRPGVYADLREEVIAFYQRVSALPPADLARMHLDRAQIQAKLEKAKSQT